MVGVLGARGTLATAGRSNGASSATPNRSRRRRARGLPLVVCMLGLITLGLRRYETGGYYLSDWVFAAAVGAVALTTAIGHNRVLAPARVRRSPNAMMVATLVLLTAGTLSSFWAAEAFDSMIVVLRLAWVTLAWFWLFRIVAIDKAALADLVLALRVTVMINSVVVIAVFLGLMAMTPPPGSKDHGNRAIGFYGHPNHLGSLLSIGCIFFLLDLSLRPKSERPRWSTALRLVCLAVVIFATSLTGSMTAAAAAIAGTVVVAAVLRMTSPSRRRSRIEPIRNIMAVVVAGLALAWFLQSDSSLLERFTLFRTGEGNTTESVASRGDFVGYVWDRFDQYLVIGVGLDVNEPEDEEGRLIGGGNHNMPMKILYQAGLPALAATVAMMFVALRMAWTLVLSTRGTLLYPLAVTLIGALVSVNVTAQAHPVTHDREFWLPIALVGSLWVVRKREIEATKAAAAPVNGERETTGPGVGRARHGARVSGTAG